MKPLRKTRRVKARPPLSPEEERAILEHLRHEEAEPYDGPPVESLPLLVEVEPPRRGVSLSEALRRTADDMKRHAARLRYTVRAEVSLNPDAFDFDVPETAQIRERNFETIREAVETARRLHEARPFGQHLRTTIKGPLGTIRVSPNGRLWGDETPNVEYELRGESLAVVRVKGDAR